MIGVMDLSNGHYRGMLLPTLQHIYATSPYLKRDIPNPQGV
jgi:hypothetical protein